MLGVGSAIHAAIYARTSQGAIAWVFALLLFPYMALFFYWIFGPRKFEGYLSKIEAARASQYAELVKFREAIRHFESDVEGSKAQSVRMLERIAPWRVTRGNTLELLVDGSATFRGIREAMELAQEYLLIQFYIWRDDELGQEVKQLLLEKCMQGVRVYCLADSVGSLGLSSSYVQELQAAGAKFSFFGSQGFIGRYSINFRNHRKAVIADGHTAFVGGHNIGEEYRGRHSTAGLWRDTQVRITGPAAQVVQATFVADWYFSTGEALPVGAAPQESGGDALVLPLATGPTSDIEDCSLMFMEAISAAEERVWIASPYFVPDEPLTQALQMAALRGKDVRIILPKKPDHLVVWLASFSYIYQMLDAGVRIYHYVEGFLHQKAFLVDRDWSCVGTANLDNRSLRLNFEMSIHIFDRQFTKQVEAMLLDDLGKSEEFTKEDYSRLPWAVVAASSAARLASPIL